MYPWDWYIYRHLVDLFYGKCILIHRIYIDPIRLGDSKSSRKTRLLIHPSNEKQMVVWAIYGIILPTCMGILKKMTNIRIPIKQPVCHGK